jgi:hypothetical protein
VAEGVGGAAAAVLSSKCLDGGQSLEILWDSCERDNIRWLGNHSPDLPVEV